MYHYYIERVDEARCYLSGECSSGTARTKASEKLCKRFPTTFRENGSHHFRNIFYAD